MHLLKSRPLEFVEQELAEDKIILPLSRKDIFKALTFFKPEYTRVIIIGQDPYPTPDNAMGLAFSVPHNRIPVSLRNIFKELKDDLGIDNKVGNLTPWAEQGVLLLNSILTVENGKPGSHAKKGWEEYTDAVINRTLDFHRPLVIIAWGAIARKKLLNLKLHDNVLVLTGNHPGPLNRVGGFFGGKYFSKTNQWLESHGVVPINWAL